jgi:UDP-N-acetylglucosamine--N-acetylmuramyl-(pentapeptide) pyrophosphoryl-undecaprenol N-acetylglucosamine transferase
LVASVAKLCVGLVQAFRLLRERKPQVILSTGGWVSLPVALTARARRIPVVVFLPDVEPGLTIKVLGRFARKIAISVPESARYFRPGQTVVTGYPLRALIRGANREQAIVRLNLDRERQTLLIFGGSRGSRAINLAIEQILYALLADGIQVIHLTGTLDWERSQEQIGVLEDHPRYHAIPYCEDIGELFAVADLVVCRAGASILGEFPLFGLPSILIPLAYSWRYQEVNADFLVERGAAIHLKETDMERELLPTIREVLADPERLHQMRSSVKQLAQPDGADNLARLVVELVQDKA